LGRLIHAAKKHAQRGVCQIKNPHGLLRLTPFQSLLKILQPLLTAPTMGHSKSHFRNFRQMPDCLKSADSKSGHWP
jgi:hypothetical protein